LAAGQSCARRRCGGRLCRTRRRPPRGRTAPRGPADAARPPSVRHRISRCVGRDHGWWGMTAAASEELRERLRTWLAEHTPRDWRAQAAASDAAFVSVQRDWMRTLDDGGWAAPKWPAEHGGLGASVA